MTDYEKTIKRLLYYANTIEDSLVKSVFHDAISLIESQRKEIDLLSRQREKTMIPKVLKYTRPASEFISAKENIYLYYCGWCGIDIRKGDRYCRNCGRKVDWNDRQRENDS